MTSMTDTLHDRLLQLGEDQRRHTKLTADLVQLEAGLRRHEARLAAMSAELDKEGRDVRKLEGLSLAVLFHTLLGNRSEQLDKERQELLAVKLRYDAELEAGQPLEEDAARCRRELAALGDLHQRRDALVAEREQQLLVSGTAAGSDLAELTDRLAKARSDLHEADEAIDAGEQALNALAETREHLGRARGWGQFDMLGGGLFATSVKHSHIDRSRAAAGRAQRHLQHLARELRDLGERGHGLEVNLSGFDKFADYFFDGLLFDWIVQGKIVRAQEGVLDMTRNVREVVLQLKRRRGELMAAQQQLEAERMQLLTGAD